MTACLHPERFVHGILAFVPDLRVDGFGIVAFSGVSGAKTSGVSGHLSKTGRKLGNPGHEAGTVDPNSRSRAPKTAWHKTAGSPEAPTKPRSLAEKTLNCGEVAGGSRDRVANHLRGTKRDGAHEVSELGRRLTGSQQERHGPVWSAGLRA